MARTSNITFAQVAQIADTMKAAGTRPTARAVRERIGSGSMGTIHKLLQQYAGKVAATDEEEDSPELPSSIASALMDFVSTQVAEACEPLNEELQAAKEAAEQIAEENERLERVIDRLTNERDEAQRNQSVSASLHRREQIEHEEAKAELAKLRQQISELKLDLDRSQRQTEMLASYAPELDKAKKKLEESERFRINAEKAVAVMQAQLTAEMDKTEELKHRAGNAEAKAGSREAELKQANIQYQACAARLEAAAREIESLRKPKAAAAAKPKAKPAPKKTDGNS
jgi:chromosome segregation ATPase